MLGATAIIERFMKSDFAQKILREDDQKAAAERRRLREERDVILAANLKARPALRAAVEKAERAFEPAKRTYDEAAAKLSEAVTAETMTNVLADGAVSRLEVRLRQTASPLIDAFVSEHHQLFNDVRARTAEEQQYRTGPRSLFTGKRPPDLRLSANADHAEHLRTILAVIREAEDLKLEPFTQDELGRALDALRARVSEKATYGLRDAAGENYGQALVRE